MIIPASRERPVPAALRDASRPGSRALTLRTRSIPAMGALRLFLAFSVFNVHAGRPVPFQLVPADTSVHAFYVVSGFYMALVLNEKYLPGASRWRDFMAARFLRLYPGYLVTAAATLAAGAFLHGAIPPVAALASATFDAVGAFGRTMAVATQATLLGLDAYYFVRWDAGGTLAFARDFRTDPSPVYDLLLVPQAWSLSLELCFYALAPWIVRRNGRALVAVIAASLLIRYAVWAALDLRTDPWSYRFFPAELAFFVAGSAAYRLTDGATRVLDQHRVLALAAIGLVLGIADWLGQVHAGSPLLTYARIPFFVLLVGGISALFRWTEHNRLDRYIGELSYPLYVSHVLVIWVFAAVWPDAGGAMLIGTAIAIAIALHHGIDLRIERLRSSFMPRPPAHAAHAPR